jgi:acyl-CoA hydrolase
MKISFRNEYQQKLCSPSAIAKRIESGDKCVAPVMGGEPREILKAMASHSKENNLKDIEHHQLLAFHDHDYLAPEMAESIKHISWFTSGFSRKAVQEGRADYMPAYYNDVPRMWNEFVKPDVFYALVSPMDEHGYFSFGVSCSGTLALKSRAERIYVEVNPNMPRTHGQNFIHISEVDMLCESSFPLAELPTLPISDLDKTIGSYVSDEIPNGATIQLGIGAIPNAIGNALIGKKDLGIHSEMFTEAFLDLIESGTVTNLKKAIHKGKSVTTFAAGSKRMYDFLNDNPGIEFRPVDYVNNPEIIKLHDNMISVNSCIEVDLLGQVCSESMGNKHYSGTGGQVDFVRGANASPGGRSYIAMHSTVKNKISKIKPILTHGSVVTTSKNDVDTIVTEYGTARLKGKTASQRAKALIELAHPDFRDELKFQAKKMNLIV